MFKNKISVEKLIILYKLLLDSLFILSVFFILAIFSEGLVPRIISAHISFFKIAFLIFLNLIAIYIIGKSAKIKIENQKPNKKTAIFLAVFGAMLVFNSLLKLKISLGIFILFLSVVSGYLVYKNILEQEK